MIRYDYGTLPTKKEIEDAVCKDNPEGDFEVGFAIDGDDYQAFQRAVNQGIDSHLEAVFVEQSQRGRHTIFTMDYNSVYVLVRRLIEAGDDASLDYASALLYSLDIEWV